MELYKKIEKIKSKADFADFILNLKNDFLKNQDEWENYTLIDYLESMSALVLAMENNYEEFHQGEEFDGVPTWERFGDILYAAKLYE